MHTRLDPGVKISYDDEEKGDQMGKYCKMTKSHDKIHFTCPFELDNSVIAREAYRGTSAIDLEHFKPHKI